MKPISLTRNCPICYSKTGIVLGKIHASLDVSDPMPGKIVIVACDGCGFVFSEGITDSILDELYKNYGVPVYLLDEIQNAKPEFRGCNPIDLVEPFVNERFGKELRVLDVGAGEGSLLKELYKNGYNNLYAIEPTASYVEQINKNTPFCAKEGSIYNIDFGHKFDLIFSIYVFEHLLDPQKAAKSIYENLNEKGLACICIPDVERYGYMSSNESMFIYEHINHFTGYHLCRLLRSVGFNVLYYCFWIMHHAIPMPMVSIIVEKNSYSKDSNILTNNTFDSMAISKMLSNPVFAIDNSLRELVEDGTPIYVWGINYITQVLLASSSLRNANIVGLIDMDKRKQGKTINGIKITSSEIILEAKKDSAIVIGCLAASSIVKQQITNMGFGGIVVVAQPMLTYPR